MPATSIVSFWAVALLLIVIPGADWAFTLDATLRGQSVLAPVAGLIVGYCILTTIVSVGGGAVVARTPAALTTLTWIGGSYLIWQGIDTLRQPSRPTRFVGAPTTTARSTVIKGIAVSGLNPKALLLFLALLPQFTQAGHSWPIGVQMWLLGAIFTITCAAFYTSLAVFAKTILHARPTVARATSRLSGSGMLIIGIALMAEHIIK